MKIILFVCLILLSTQLFAQENLKDNNQMYSFVYEFNNYSLGPIQGTHRAKIYIKDKQIISIINLKTGTTSKSILGIEKLIEAIESNHTQLVTYDDNHFPKTIKPKSTNNRLGSGYIIEIEDFHSVDEITSAKKERLAEFDENYLKWMHLNIKNYSYIYQDSRQKDTHMEGLEVSIKDQKVLRVFDARSMQKIKSFLSSQILTIDKLFAIVKQGLHNDKNIEVLYHKKYGYPYLIAVKENNQLAYQIFARKLQIGK